MYVGINNLDAIDLVDMYVFLCMPQVHRFLL
jgi:hypothetical protein